MKKRLAIIGASYLQLPLIEKAKAMGYETHVFAWQVNDVGEKAADYFYPISIIDKEEILKKCRELKICGICSIASDLATITVNYVAVQMGLNGNSLEATEVSTNKYLMRMELASNQDPSPKSIRVDWQTKLEELKLEYPIIIKPTDRSGSRGVHKLDTPEGLEAAVEEALEASFEKKALIEEYVEGKEYSVEYISFQGRHHFLALTEKVTTEPPHFIETAHFEPAEVSVETLAKVREIVEHALDSLMIQNSASHSEIKIHENGTIKIIEIGARMGGDCIGSHLVEMSTGIDYVKGVIQVACGEEPDLVPKHPACKAMVRYILNDKDLEEYRQIKQKTPERIVREIYLEPELLNKVTDSSNRAGCYILV